MEVFEQALSKLKNGEQFALVTVIGSSGSVLAYSTYIGGAGTDLERSPPPTVDDLDQSLELAGLFVDVELIEDDRAGLPVSLAEKEWCQGLPSSGLRNG